MQLLRALFVTQAAHTVRLPGAHLLQQTGGGVVPLVVDLAADGIDQVGLLTFKVGAHKPAPFGDRIADQLAHQLRRRFQQLLPLRGKAVVDQEAGHEAHALVLTLLADGVLHGGAVQPVQDSADRAPRSG